MRKVKKGRRWTKHEEAFLREHYPNEKTEDIAKVLRRTTSSVRDHAGIIGVRKTAEFLSSLGRPLAECAESHKTRFEKGHVSHNKGKKLWQFMSPESMEKCRKTMFKPGHVPHNVKPLGYEKVRDGYVYVKVEGHSRMVRKHIWVWEQHNGKVPKGHILMFIDGDRTNCDISNLRLTTRAESARITCMSRSPEERARIYHKITIARNESIRKDKMRIRWGLEPKTKLVKKWYAPQM